MPIPDPSSLPERTLRRHLYLLLAAAAVLFIAASNQLSLPSLDDCFYARKGVEMHQRGAVFDVTWNGQPTFQNPPLQLWILARSFGLFGYNDLAARLPSIAMALGILLGTYLIGERTVGREASLLGICLLLLSPYFINNARRCMLEIPLTFWVVGAVLVFARGLERPRMHLLFGFPLAGAMLTKSLLGLLSVTVVVGGTLALTEEVRKSFDKRWIAIGFTLGILLGFSWSLYLALHYGPGALREHYVEEIVSRSSAGFDLRGFILDYPSILIRDFQIVVLPAMVGLFAMARRRSVPSWFLTLLLLWLIAFPLVLNFSSARTARYIFPVFPALALSGGYWLAQTFDRLSKHLYRWFVPALALLLAAVFCIHPSTLTRDRNAPMKENATLIREMVPSTEAIPYAGGNYWVVANSLMYYADRRLDAPSPDLQAAAEQALRSSSRLLFCAPDQLPALRDTGHSLTVLIEADEWVLLRLERQGARTVELESEGGGLPNVALDS